MSTLLRLCYARPDIAAELQQLDEQIDAVAAPLRVALDALNTEEAQDIAAEIFKDVIAHDQLFTDSPVQNLDGAYQNAGLPTTSRTRQAGVRSLIDNGFVVVNGNIYVCNSRMSQPGSAKNVDVQAPENDEELRTVLDDVKYVDPAVSSVVSYTGAVDTNRSVTGPYISPGTVQDLREIVRGFGGALAPAMEFLKEIDSKQVTGVVWSMLHYQVVHKSDVELDNDSIRAQVQFPLYDEDINIFGDYAIVTTEIHVRYQVPQSTAYALAKKMCRDLGIPQRPALVCRLVRLNPSDNVRGQSPVIATTNFDALKLGPASFRLGINVCGYKRIVDVTGDRGSRSVYDEYSASGVAAAVTRVFGDLVSVAAVGNELCFVVNRRGFSSGIGFFDVGAGDAAEACGINGAIQRESVRAGSHSAHTLKTLKTVYWTGGEDSVSDVTSEFISAMNTFEIPQTIKDACILRSSLYSYADEEATAAVDVIVAAADAGNASTAVKALESYANMTGFVDIVGLRYQNARLLHAEMGDGLSELLRSYAEVWEVDVYRTQRQVQADVAELLQEHLDADAVVVVSNDFTTITASRKNKAKLSRFYGMHRFLESDPGALPQQEQTEMQAQLNAYASSLYWDNTTTLSRRLPDTALPAKADSSVSTLWFDFIDNATNFFDNPNGAVGDAMAAAVDYACRQDPDACAQIRSAFATFTDEFGSKEQQLADFLDRQGRPVSDGLGWAASAIAKLNRLIDRAIAMIREAKAKTTAYIQGALNTKKPLPEVLTALANLNINVYDNFGFQSKFLSCYVSGNGGVLLSALWSKLIAKVNLFVDKINDMISALIEVMQKALDLLVCLADKISQGFEGAITYEKSGAGVYRAAGIPLPVTFTMTCTASFGYDGMDPALARELAKLKEKLTTLLLLFRLQAITYTKLDDSVMLYKAFEITSATTAGQLVEQLREQIRNKLLSLLSC